MFHLKEKTLNFLQKSTSSQYCPTSCWPPFPSCLTFGLLAPRQHSQISFHDVLLHTVKVILDLQKRQIDNTFRDFQLHVGQQKRFNVGHQVPIASSQSEAIQGYPLFQNQYSPPNTYFNTFARIFKASNDFFVHLTNVAIIKFV
jgi:hypothetical protein